MVRFGNQRRVGALRLMHPIPGAPLISGLALLGCLFLASCVASSNSPSQKGIGAVLTPSAQDRAAVANKRKPKADSKPETATAKVETPADNKTAANTQTALTKADEDTKTPAAVATEKLAANQKQTSKPAAGKSATAKSGTAPKTASTATTTNAAPQPTKKSNTTLLSSLFTQRQNAERPNRRRRAASSREDVVVVPIRRTRRSAATTSQRQTATRSRGGSSLPGVRRKGLFGISEGAATRDFDKPVKVAAVTNLARRGAHGLLLQRPDVKVGCFPQELLRLLKRVERRYGRTPIVTSGYRSPRYNRLIGGARRSTHVQCRAADIQVKGVSKWQLAKFVRTIPGRGGVGTYCHTNSVHVDVGKVRAWHYCRRKRRRR